MIVYKKKVQVKACQKTAKVTMELWPTTMLQSRFYLLLIDILLPFLFLQNSNQKTYFCLYLITDLKWKTKNLKWASKHKTKRKRMRFEVTLFCKYLSCIIIEKHFVKLTCKLTFVHTNVTKSNYIQQRTKKAKKNKKV